jgi:ABC-2 type transport system ATP-binding protein
LTTHDLGDIEELCPRVLIIDRGSLIYDGPLDAIKARFGKYREITFETARPVSGLTLPKGSELVAGSEATRTTLRFDRAATTASQVAASVMDQVEVVDFSISEPDLASIVRQIYAGGLNSER